jgi:putative NADH-flavin reductase
LPVFADKVVVFGASGSIGKKIVTEALDRGHDVIGVSRSPEKFSYTQENFTGVKGNPTDISSVKEIITGADSILVAVGGRTATDPDKTAMNLTAQNLSQVLSSLGQKGPQVVVIGGGMTMFGGEEEMIKQLPPNATEGSPFYALFLGHLSALKTYQASNINWTFIAPPLTIKGFRGGEDIRTGKYRTSTTDFVKDAEGNNAISISDLAVAALDFAENGSFNKRKVALGE